MGARARALRPQQQHKRDNAQASDDVLKTQNGGRTFSYTPRSSGRTRGGAGRDEHYDEGRKEKKTSFAGAPGTRGVVLCPLIPEEASSQIELAPLPRKVRNTFC